MPQLSQIAEIYASQLVWLLIVFAIIYFGIGRGMVSKIEATVDTRDRRIADDLTAARSAREIADRTEEAYRARMDAAKASAARAAEARVKAADATLADKADAAGAQLAEARASALSGIEDVAAEAAREIVQRVSGLAVDRDAAARAVKTAMAHG